MTPEFARRNFKVTRVHGKLEWRFEPRRGSGKAYYFRLRFDPISRTFTGVIMNWTQRKKPGQVRRDVSAEIAAALREALPESAIAACAAAAITPPAMDFETFSHGLLRSVSDAFGIDFEGLGRP